MKYSLNYSQWFYFHCFDLRLVLFNLFNFTALHLWWPKVIVLALVYLSF